MCSSIIMFPTNFVFFDAEKTLTNECIPSELMANCPGANWMRFILPRDCWAPFNLSLKGLDYSVINSPRPVSPLSYHFEYPVTFYEDFNYGSDSFPSSPCIKSPSWTNADFHGDAKWPFPKTRPPPISLPGWKALPYGLERFWMNAFVWLFLDLFENQHLWTLRPVERPPQDDAAGLPWISVIHSAKVRFNCDAANHGWTSMQGRVVFWYRVLHGVDSSGYVRGEVVFKLYGQKCDRCTSNNFETALWYPEEISNALWRLYSHISEKCYGFTVITPTRGSRGGKPLRPHKPELCQACNDGVCRIGNS